MQKNTQKKNNAVVEKDLNHFLMLMDQKGQTTIPLKKFIPKSIKNIPASDRQQFTEP